MEDYDRGFVNEKKFICSGCKTSNAVSRMRRATLKHSISVSINKKTSVVVGDPICPQCRRLDLEEEEYFVAYMRREHEISQSFVSGCEDNTSLMDVVVEDQGGDDGGKGLSNDEDEDGGSGGSCSDMSTEDENIPFSQGSVGTEWRADFWSGVYLKCVEIIHSANPSLRIPPHSLKDDRADGKKIIRREGVKIQNLIEVVTEMLLPYTEKSLGIRIVHKCMENLRTKLCHGEDLSHDPLPAVFR